ncbi:MAG: PQQ-dependent sugar dehydrogenase [Pseudomonadota bacterium]
MHKKLAITTAALLATTPLFAQAPNGAHEWGPMNAPDYKPAYDAQFRAPIQVSDYELQTSDLATGLEHPWAVEELPDGAGYLVTERPGRLRHISIDGTMSDPIAGLPEVEGRPQDESWPAQGGLLDVKIGPSFAEDRMIYLTYAKPLPNDMSATAAARGILSEDLTQLTSVEEIFVQEPPSPTRMHYGSRIVFDDDGHAFITTGEHSSLMERDFSQQLDKTYGKIIRVNLDGSVPDDNPYLGVESAVDSIWSYGHRNVQGAAMKDGFLYTIEHGPAGGDEVNMPLPGRNYGWPVVSYGVRYTGVPVGTGKQSMPGMDEPIYYWDPVIAPGDMAFYEGSVFPDWEGDMLIGALVAGGMVRLDLDGPLVKAEERILADLGRVRDVEVLSDGTLLLATDYEDGKVVHVTNSLAN